MAHSFHKIWLHIIFGTKYRMPLITEQLEIKLFAHIRNQLKKLECNVLAINGVRDHVHLLISIHPKLAVADIIKQVKGSSSYWINQQSLIKEKFSWQTGYGVFSVSESQLKKVKSYIENQKEHHKISNSLKEYSQFLKIHDIDINDENH